MGRLLLISLLLGGCAGHGVLGSDGDGAGVLPELGPPSAKPPAGAAPAVAMWSRPSGASCWPRTGPGSPARAQLCVREGTSDRLTCLRPVEADTQGDFQVTVPDDTRCIGAAAMRVLAPGEATAISYCTLDLSGGPAVVLPEPWSCTRPARRAACRRPMAATPRPTPWTSARAPGGRARARLYGGGGSPYDELTARKIDPGAPGLCFPDAVAGLTASTPSRPRRMWMARASPCASPPTSRPDRRRPLRAGRPGLHRRRRRAHPGGGVDGLRHRDRGG
ncbi:MAG: hypothetical protein R3F43_24270 [bacterium]